ncbi:hypothetical protein J14TS2_30710 [Bacillus sp. J14TS2]|uniref:hypothetical protein n=1 Tax=Bacillus sp. J14TS2 TaxID=2807188 RepID=UPI001B18E84F|nr:hypothetical protein [Bacillus sp. J14TS2]GIN72596.1 hypothetical protein J14TS2_30710 [Bacillus sp. J14TS2]
MLVAPCLHDLMQAKYEIENLNKTRPTLFHKFINIIQLTRQLHYKYQLMGAMIMDEDPSEFITNTHNDYVFSVYKAEIDKLKADHTFQILKQFLARNKEMSYGHICKLALGIHPSVLVGPTFVR